MKLVRYKPNTIFDQLQKDLYNWPLMTSQDASSSATSDWAPQVDIKEEKDRFIVLADIPGVDPKDIEVTMENNVLTVRGEKKTEKEEEGKNYTRIERVYGSFYRQFTLPDTADNERISAKSKHGVLELSIPKLEKSKHRKINIDIQE